MTEPKKKTKGKPGPKPMLPGTLTPSERRVFVMQNLGVKTYAQMAAELGITETMVYQYLDSIRKDRKALWSKELTQDICDEQLNRRGTMVLETWKDYFDAKGRLTDLREALKTGKLDGKTLTDEMKVAVRDMLLEVKKETFYSRIAYDNQERGLTQLLKAVGVYAPDILLQQNNIQVLNLDAEKALKDVREKYGKEMADQLEMRMKQRAIELKAKDTEREVNDRPGSKRRTGDGDKGAKDKDNEPQARTQRLGPEAPAPAREAGRVQGPRPGQAQQTGSKPHGGKPSKERRK